MDILAKDYENDFSTKTLRVNHSILYVKSCSPYFLVVFDQLIDSDAVLKVTKVTIKVKKNGVFFCFSLIIPKGKRVWFNCCCWY